MKATQTKTLYLLKNELSQAKRDLESAKNTLHHNQESARIWGNSYAIAGLREDQQRVRDCRTLCRDLMADIKRASQQVADTI